MDLTNFRKQLQEDLNFIKESYLYLDPNLKKDEYAFNFWIQTKMYEVDEEVAINNITEYNDKGIDCFVHYEETKELFLIQNKYYSENTNLNVKEVSHFLTTSLGKLEEGNYKNLELQKAYNLAKSDSSYKVWLHFYITNDKITQDIINVINEFNKGSRQVLCEIRAKHFSLADIYDLYFGASFKKDIKFKHIITTKNRGTFLQIKPEDYNLPGMSEAYYIMTPITTLYEMYKESKKSDYPLFEENIREYLGKSSINTGIIKTLRDENERKNFFYYNNGVTIICDSSKKITSNKLELDQPQIVNGCQTVNTIYEVLDSYSPNEITTTFNGVYVMTKILIQTNKTPDFYKKVVKFTNSQNSINEKAFASTTEYFLRIQEHFLEKGFLLLVKPSDKHKYSKLTPVEKNKLIAKASKAIKNIDSNFTRITDIAIPLDKLLQVALAYIKDGYFAYTKKSQVLKPTSELYKTFSTKITEYLTVDNLIYLYLLYRKAEIDKKSSEDQKTPMPYYLISYMSFYLKEKNSNNLNKVIEMISEKSKDDFNKIYDYFKDLTAQYKAESPLEYNVMIKNKIDKKILEEQINTLNRLAPYKTGKDFIKEIAEI